MLYCKKCGIKLDDDALFCPSCGTPVAKTKKSEKANTPQKSETVNQGGTMINVNWVYGKTDIEKLPKGYEIDNRYKVMEKIGQGSFGAVYKVYDKDMETEKALKIIPEAVINDKEAMLSLRKEAAIMVKLNHKNIVRVYDFHHNGDIKYIDMEYVEGGSLADIKLTKPDKKFPEEEVKEYAIQVLEGLSYAHKKKIIHKDIKPQNLMLDKSGKVKIMDFGIAETVHSSMSRLKNTGSSGTLVYMSPEQLQGKDVGREADIYSLGASMYELLSGQPPFYRGDITYQIINKKPEKIKGISYQMNSIIQKSLKKDMKDRYLDCDEFKKALREKQITEKEPKEELKEENKINEEEIIKPQQIYEQTQDKTITTQKKKKSHTGLIIFLLTIALIIFGIVYYNNKREQEITEQQKTEHQQLKQEQKDKAETERLAEQQRQEEQRRLDEQRKHEEIFKNIKIPEKEIDNFSLEEEIKRIKQYSKKINGNLIYNLKNLNPSCFSTLSLSFSNINEELKINSDNYNFIIKLLYDLKSEEPKVVSLYYIDNAIYNKCKVIEVPINRITGPNTIQINFSSDFDFIYFSLRDENSGFWSLYCTNLNNCTPLIKNKISTRFFVIDKGKYKNDILNIISYWGGDTFYSVIDKNGNIILELGDFWSKTSPYH